MARWHFEFDVDGRHMEHIMELLQPLRVENFACKIVAGTPTKIRAGDKPAWQIVAEMANTKPQPSTVFHEALRKAGFKNAGSAIDQAHRKGVIKKTKRNGELFIARKGS